MKYSKFISAFIVICIVLQTINPMVLFAFDCNDVSKFCIKLKCPEEVDATEVSFDISITVLNETESTVDIQKYENEYAFSINANSMGKVEFNRPSECFIVFINTNTIPQGYGVDRESCLITKDYSTCYFEILPIALVLYEDNGKTKEPVYFSNNNKRIITNPCNRQAAQVFSSSEPVINNDNCIPICMSKDDFDIQLSQTTMRTDPVITTHFEIIKYCSDATITSSVMENIANAFESIWEFFCNNIGLNEPRGDLTYGHYTVYIFNCASDAETRPGNTPTSSFIRINPSLATTISNALNSNTTCPEIGILAHEYMHAIMRTYHISAKWMQESFANAAAIIYTNNTNDTNDDFFLLPNGSEYFCESCLYTYLSNIDLPVDFSTSTPEEDIWFFYGLCVYPYYLYKYNGGFNTWKSIFEECSTPVGGVYPAPLDAIRTTINSLSNATDYFGKTFGDFAACNHDVEQMYDFPQPHDINSYSPATIGNHAAYPVATTVSTDVDRVASRLIKFTPTPNTNAKLAITITKSEDPTDVTSARMQLRTAVKNSSGQSTINYYSTSTHQARYVLVIDNFGTANSEVWMSVANSGFSDSISFTYSAQVLYYPGINLQYSFRNIGSGKVLQAGSGNDGANVYQMTGGSTTYQDFKFLSGGSTGVYKLIGLYSDYPNFRYLTQMDLNGMIQNGSNAASCSLSTSVQNWKFIEVEYGIYRICCNSDNTLVLSVDGNATGSVNGNIYLKTYSSNNDYQLWELIPA